MASATSFGPAPPRPLQPDFDDPEPLPPLAYQVQAETPPEEETSWAGQNMPSPNTMLEANDQMSLDMIMLKLRNSSSAWFAQRSLGTPLQSICWRLRAFELSGDRLVYWTKTKDKLQSSSPPGSFPLDVVDEVALRGTQIVINFSSEQVLGTRRKLRKSLTISAASADEAERFAKTLRSLTAARLSKKLSLPPEWDICSMLEGSADGARLVAKIPLDANSLSIVQELVDHTFLAKRTKDRGGLEMPVRLEVTEVVKVQNTSAWLSYCSTRTGIASSFGEPEGSLTPRIRTSLFDHPLAHLILGGLEEAAVEHWLFHGSGESAVRGITNTDFRLDLAGSHKGTLYGRGLYCAECSSKADEYAEPEDGLCRMLLCRATLGRILHDKSVKPNGEELASRCMAEFNSLCGDRWAAVGTYREFVFFNNGQVYPAYMITYRRVTQTEFLTAVGNSLMSNDQLTSLKLVPHALRLAETHSDADVRYRVSMLMSAHSEAVTPVLVELLQSRMQFVRRSAAAMLGQIAEYLTRTVEAALHNRGQFGLAPGTGRDVARIKMAMSVVPSLQACLADESEGVRRAVLFALGTFQSHALSAVPGILESAIDIHAEVRQAAVTALGQIPEAAEAALPVLSLSLGDADNGVREAAATSLGQFAFEQMLAHESQVLQRLIDCLLDQDLQVRKAATKSLGHQARVAARSLQALLDVLKDQSSELRETAAWTIGCIGARVGEDDSHAATCVQAGALLVDCLRDETIAVQKASIVSLGQISPHVHNAVPALRKFLGDVHHKEHKELRCLSIETLGLLGPKAGSAVLDLGNALRDADGEVRKAAADAIGLLQDQCTRALPSLTERIKDQDVDVRRSAAVAFARLGKHAAPALVSLKEFLNDANAGVRQYAHLAYSRVAAALGDDLEHVLETGKKYAFLSRYKFASDASAR